MTTNEAIVAQFHRCHQLPRNRRHDAFFELAIEFGVDAECAREDGDKALAKKLERMERKAWTCANVYA